MFCNPCNPHVTLPIHNVNIIFFMLHVILPRICCMDHYSQLVFENTPPHFANYDLLSSNMTVKLFQHWQINLWNEHIYILAIASNNLMSLMSYFTGFSCATNCNILLYLLQHNSIKLYITKCPLKKLINCWNLLVSLQCKYDCKGKRQYVP